MLMNVVRAGDGLLQEEIDSVENWDEKEVEHLDESILKGIVS